MQIVHPASTLKINQEADIVILQRSGMTMTFNAETFFKITAHLLTIGTLWIRSEKDWAKDIYGLD